MEIIIGQLDLSPVSTTLADNLQNPVTVFSGTLQITDATEAWDWLVIPLDTPYVLETDKHLVIQTRLPTGTPVTSAKFFAHSSSSSRYQPYIAGGLDADATTITAQAAIQLDPQLTLETTP